MKKINDVVSNQKNPGHVGSGLRMVKYLMCIFPLLSGANVYPDGLATDYDSLPPLISTGGSADRPNVLLMLDTSASMQWDADGYYVGSNHKDSRVVIARQAIADIMSRFNQQVNMGLMTFEPTPNFTYARTDWSFDNNGDGWNEAIYFDLDGDGTKETRAKEWWYDSGSNWPNNYQVREGYLYIPIGSIDPTDTSASTIARLQDFDTKLGLSIVSQPAPNNGFYNLYTYDRSTYSGSTDQANKRIPTEGGTPIAGTFATARQYFDPDGTGVGVPDSQRDTSYSTKVWPAGNQCGGNEFAILLTDGVPTVRYGTDSNGNDVTGRYCPSGTDCKNTNAPALSDALEEAALLYNNGAGVKTYVIGLGLTDSEKLQVEQIAQAAGKEPAYFADSLSSLTAAMQAIYLDIVNKTASGTGAAVVANRGSGLSADFQALYTPQYVDESNKSASWVGTLHGFFIDEELNLREDTNQDGLLSDDDRILLFQYDEADKVTYVEQISYLTKAVEAISKVEDINSIWNARNRLSELTNVTAQRDYSAKASNGRRIYTSTDGSTLLDFVPILDPTQLADLEAEQKKLINVDIPAQEAKVATALVALSTAMSGMSGSLKIPLEDDIQAILAQLGLQYPELLAALEAGTLTKASAQSDENTKKSTRDNAQTAKNTADGELATAISNETTAQGEVTTATKDRDDAQTAVNNATTDEATKKGIYEGAESALTTAKKAVTDYQPTWDAAKKAKDDADSAVTTATGELETAQKELDAANEYIAQLDADGVPPTSKAYTDAVADRDAKELTRNEKQGVLTTALGTQSTASGNFTTVDGTMDGYLKDQTDAQKTRDDAYDDWDTAVGTLGTANSNLTKAQGILDNKEQALADAKDEVTAKTNAQTDAQTALDIAQAEYDTAITVSEVADTYDWIKQIEGFIAQINEFLSSPDSASLDVFANLEKTLREDLLTLMKDYIDALPGALRPSVTNVDLIPDLATLLDTLALNYSNLGSAQYVNSLYAATVSYHTEKSSLEDLQGQLLTVSDGINQKDYLQYMDDNIVGQTDVDLTYDQRNAIVTWTRGEEVTGLRNRTVDFDEDGVDEVWRLGDIVHSTPAVVGRPTSLYYSRYNDPTYRRYMEAKFNRRQVVYVGSNSGMLHAFNAGFWDDSKPGYVTQLTGDTSVAHELGTELWSFIPKSALPFLQFVADPGYNHMAIMDGSPQSFDVNIFPADTVHTDGWGTILVVTMHMGGGNFTVRVDEDEDGTDEDVVIRPSILIFDVTNPEADPVLMAELTHPNLGHTLSKPTVIKRRQPSVANWDSPAQNEWLLVFGSGPTDLDTATSNQQAMLYAYKLNHDDRGWEETHFPKVLTEESNAFVSDLTSVDWDRDFIDDAVYFGLNTGNAAASDGRLMRLELDSPNAASTWLQNASVSTFMDIGRTVISAPMPWSDTYGNRWIYAGTGRLLVAADNSSTQQEYFFGVKEPIDTNNELTFGTVSTSGLLDITNIDVYTNPDKIENGPTGVETPGQLSQYIDDYKDGWFRELTQNGSAPSGRSDTKPTEYLSTVAFSEYLPSNDSCDMEGTSLIWILDLVTGVASKERSFDKEVDATTGLTKVIGVMDAGKGKIGDMSTLPGGKLLIHDSTGRVRSIEPILLKATKNRQSWRQIFEFGF